MPKNKMENVVRQKHEKGKKCGGFRILLVLFVMSLECFFSAEFVPSLFVVFLNLFGVFGCLFGFLLDTFCENRGFHGKR